MIDGRFDYIRNEIITELIMKNKMTNEPDYRIEECFYPEEMRVYFRVYSLEASPSLIATRFDTLDEAKDCVRMCRKYENRVFHYVED
jgi:hypothetical protein